MSSFATGIVVALLLAGGTFYALQAGTITVVERTHDRATLTASVWGTPEPGGMLPPSGTMTE